MSKLLDVLLDLFFPAYCLACRARLLVGAGTAPPGFCDGCRATFISGLEGGCPSCGVVWLDPPPGGGAHLCGPCQSQPPPWVEARGAFAYGGALQEAIARWKNTTGLTGGDALGAPLVGLMLGAIARAGWDRLASDTIVVPVPATRAALIRRGFNPAGVLAHRLARRIARRFEPTALTIRRVPEPSAGLGRAARRRRMRGVFDATPRRVAGRTVLLVDDVMTTGATVRAATDALLRAGARGVRIAVLARVPGGS
ncbi:MAG: ComF family protein [Deltaproteobacteria bacterium]|nr:ComF family protein [Deltaproteobacteria bacterium]